MRFSSIAAPFDSEPEEKQEPIAAIQERVREDVEVNEALDQLVYSLEYGVSKSQAYATFCERIAYIVSRARTA